MNAIAADPQVGAAFCRRLLSVLLQREIGEVSVIAQLVQVLKNALSWHSSVCNLDFLSGRTLAA